MNELTSPQVVLKNCLYESYFDGKYTIHLRSFMLCSQNGSGTGEIGGRTNGWVEFFNVLYIAEEFEEVGSREPSNLKGPYPFWLTKVSIFWALHLEDLFSKIASINLKKYAKDLDFSRELVLMQIHWAMFSIPYILKICLS